MSSLLGTRLSILMGQAYPLPPVPDLTRNLKSVTIDHPTEGRSTFTMSFRAERGRINPWDYGLLGTRFGGAMPPTRVVLTALFGPKPEVLMDGIIQSVSLQPGDGAGAPDQISVSGEDLTVLMDQEELSRERMAPTLEGQVFEVLAPYLRYGMVPEIIPATTQDLFDPLHMVILQQGTDYAFVSELAEQAGHVFKLIPGPFPTTSRVFWGPEAVLRARAQVAPQPAISVNLGPASNASGLTFSFHSAAVEEVAGAVLRSGPVSATPREKMPLSRIDAVKLVGPHIRKGFSEQLAQTRNASHARARAQALADMSMSDAVMVEGTLDVLRYGGVLKPLGLVGVRGAGLSFDGEYFVNGVTHNISEGRYTQSFTLSRSGLGARSLRVRP